MLLHQKTKREVTLQDKTEECSNGEHKQIKSKKRKAKIRSKPKKEEMKINALLDSTALTPEEILARDPTAYFKNQIGDCER